MRNTELHHSRSTNGRWGLVLVGPEGTKFPAEGRVEYIGTVAGKKTFRFTPCASGEWGYVGGDVKVHGGATVIEEMGLQSSNYTSLLVLGKQAVIQEFGYKGRISEICAFIEGKRVRIPDTVLLLDMELIKLSPKDADL